MSDLQQPKQSETEGRSGIFQGTPDFFSFSACKDLPTRWFFPERGESVREAKATCAGCRIRTDCLEFAMDNDIQHGIWGGTSERERKSLRRRRKMLDGQNQSQHAC